MSDAETATFAQGSLLWFSLAARGLGWRPGEFWRATPAELVAAIREPTSPAFAQGPNRDLIAQMLERDNHE